MSLSAPDPRERVGPYQLIRAIGAGGSARIDLARVERAYNFQRHVVIKRPLEHLRADRNVAASLRREARIGGRLRHPNLVAVLDAGEHAGYDYLVLEYVHGASLRELMQTEHAGVVRHVPLAVALGLAIDIGRGLHEAHELVDERGASLGLVHRDVSPGNVLLGLDGSVKVADFGIAKETRVSTLSGSMHGTVTYMAPEQCRGHAFDRRADVFSLGVILYELLTQRRLFWADNDVASLHRVLSGQIEPPRRVRPHLSPALEDIVMTALAQDPSKRFATARQLADGLEALAAAESCVLGARLLARTLEEVVGARAVPWIKSTTMIDIPSYGEGSLVQVIESLGPDLDAEPILPTFGPRDEKVVEEGEVPSTSGTPARARTEPVRGKRRSGPWFMLASALAIAAGMLAAFIWVGGGRSKSAAVTPATGDQPPAVHPPAVQPPPVQPPADDASIDLDEPPAEEPTTQVTPPPSRPNTSHKVGRGNGGHKGGGRPAKGTQTATTPAAAGSGAGSATTTSGSGSASTDVEWKPSIFSPHDVKSGSGSK